MGLLERLSGGSRTILSGDESEFAAVKPTPSRGSREGVWEREGGLRVLPGTSLTVPEPLPLGCDAEEREPHPVRLFIAP
jgi:hypothetical protein